MKKRNFILPLLGLSVFIFIAYFVAANDVLVFDTVIRESVYGIRSDLLTGIMIGITYLGNWQAITLLCILFLVHPKTRFSFGVPLSAAAIISLLAKDLLKHSFMRERPDLYLHLIEQGGYSYPSGHSMTSLIFYGMLILLIRQKIKNRTIANAATALLSVIILSIGFSRIYLGVHFPTDVLGGWAVGVLILSVLSAVVLSLQRKD